jgi:hypothetical protein
MVQQPQVQDSPIVLVLLPLDVVMTMVAFL